MTSPQRAVPFSKERKKKQIESNRKKIKGGEMDTGLAEPKLI